MIKVSIIGYGALGKAVAAGILAQSVAGVELYGVVSRYPLAGSEPGRVSLEQAMEGSSLLIECAGGPAAREIGPRIIAAGKDLLLASVGAVADPATRASLLAGPGRLHLTTGAIGGLDILSAAARTGGLQRAAITSSKLPGTLIQPWMEPERAAQISSAAHPLVVFEGTVERAIELFPKSLNVAVAVAHATGLWDDTVVRLVADPEAHLTRHSIEASGSTGNYRFDITNEPSASNPATSAVVASALLHGIARLSNPSGSFI